MHNYKAKNPKLIFDGDEHDLSEKIYNLLQNCLSIEERNRLSFLLNYREAMDFFRTKAIKIQNFVEENFKGG